MDRIHRDIHAASILRSELSKNAQHSKNARELHRLHCVLLVKLGYSCREIADCFNDSCRSVERWIKRFDESGIEGLIEKKQSGRPRKLTDEQLHTLGEIINSHPAYFGLHADRWDGALLQRQIQISFHVSLSVRQCQRFLQSRAEF